MHKLTVLPEGNPCRGCQFSCCDPVNVGFAFELPLPPGHPQHIAPLAIQSTVWKNSCHALQQRAATNVREENPDISRDSRFSITGYSLWTNDDWPREIQCERTSMPGVLVDVAIMVRCAVFDPSTGLCGDYENRPKICRDLLPQTCGRSPLFPNMPDGTPFPPLRQQIVFYRGIIRRTKATLDEALNDLQGKLFCQFR